MKKNSKRRVKNYGNCYDGDYEYYGVFKKNLDVKIDVKRMLNLHLIDEKISKMMNQDRQTTYYVPKMKNRHDYYINIFRDMITDQEKLWYEELLPAIHSIETPNQVQHRTSTGDLLLSGILSHEEASIHGTIEMIKRIGAYNKVILSFLVQFIHQFVSHIESTTLKVITKDGYKESNFSRNTLNSYIQGSTKKYREPVTLETIPYYEKYDKLYKVWHFLKHNSLDLYEKLHKNYPKVLLTNKNYKNGDLAMDILKIDFEFIHNMFIDMKQFFESFCEKVFLENVETSKWDYSTYFIAIVDKQIKEIKNPLGLPDL